MCIGHGIDQLHIDPHLIVGLLHTAFEDVHYSQLLRNRGEIFRRAFEMLRRRARNYFEVGDFRQPREDFILHPFTKISIVGIATQIVERQHRDRFLW